MQIKTFLNLKAAESLKAYPKMLENSDDKWESANDLATNGKYGSAIVMAIVSVEEMVKALVVLLNGRGFQFGKVKGMNRFFKNHQIRYVIAYAMFVVNVFSEELIFFLKKFRENPDTGMDFLNGIVSNDETAHRQLNEYAIKKFELMVHEFEWFSRIDIFRQNGMYVDFQDHLKTPIDIDEVQYKETYSRLEKVRRVGVALADALNSRDELYIKHFDSLKNQFIKEKYYEKIESGLARLAATREQPFQALKALFNTSQPDSNK